MSNIRTKESWERAEERRAKKEGLAGEAARLLLGRRQEFYDYHQSVHQGDLDHGGIDLLLFKSPSLAIVFNIKSSSDGVRIYYEGGEKDGVSPKTLEKQRKRFALAPKDGETAEEFSRRLEKAVDAIEKNSSMTPYELYLKKLPPFEDL